MPRIFGVFPALNRFIARANTSLVLIAGILFFLAMFETVADVTGRYLFTKPVPGTIEIGEAVLAFSIFLSMAYVLMHHRHIRVTVFLERLPPEWRAWLDISAFMVGFLFMFITAWQAFPYAMESYVSKQVGIAFPLPIYPAKFAFFVGCAMFSLQFFIEFISHLYSKLVHRIPTGEGKS